MSGKTQCPGCGACYEVAVPVMPPTSEAVPPATEAQVDQNAAISGVLPYRTAPSPSAEPRASRWRISGKSSKRAVCHKCGTAYRYELTRQVRSWSVKTVFGICSLVVLLGLSCLFPAVLIGAGGLLLLSARFWVRIVFIAVRSFSGGGGSLKVGGDFASANRRLRKELDFAVEPVACPKCGWFQPEMVSEARARAFAWAYWTVLGFVALAPLIWFYSLRYRLVT